MKTKTRAAKTDILSDEQMRDFQANVIGTQEAAELLGVTQDHLESLIRRAKIVGKRLGSKYWAVYRPSLLRYLKNKSAKGKPPSNKPKLEQ